MSLLDHLEHLRSRPEHIRRRIALASATTLTGFVFFGWLVSFATSGTLTLKQDAERFAEVAGTAKEFPNLLGAATAFQSAIDKASSITVVETRASSTLDVETTGDATVIPF